MSSSPESRHGFILSTREKARQEILHGGENKAAASSPPYRPNLPPIFVDIVKKVSKDLGGLIFVFRGNTSDPLYTAKSAPKPPSVKAKTTNQGPIAGTIPQDSRLGRVEINKETKAKSIKPYQPEKDFKYEAGEIKTPTIRHKLSLKSLMEGLNATPPKYRLADNESNIKESNLLRVWDMENKDFNEVVYSINLLDERKTPSLEVKHENISIKTHQDMPAKPSWFNGEQSEWEKAVHSDYPAFYKIGKESTQPLMVYAHDVLVDEKTLERRPITGDQDVLWMGVPVELAKTLSSESLTNLNTRIAKREYDGPRLMRNQLLLLEDRFHLGIDIDKINVADFGIGTPLELYAFSAINQKVAHLLPHHLAPIQHGAESNNPGAPSNLNELAHHISDEKVFSTHSEAELEHATTREHYQNALVTPNAQWNKSLWTSHYERQVALRGTHDLPLIDEAVKKAYDSSEEIHEERIHLSR